MRRVTRSVYSSSSLVPSTILEDHDRNRRDQQRHQQGVPERVDPEHLGEQLVGQHQRPRIGEQDQEEAGDQREGEPQRSDQGRQESVDDRDQGQRPGTLDQGAVEAYPGNDRAGGIDRRRRDDPGDDKPQRAEAGPGRSPGGTSGDVAGSVWIRGWAAGRRSAGYPPPSRREAGSAGARAGSVTRLRRCSGTGWLRGIREPRRAGRSSTATRSARSPLTSPTAVLTGRSPSGRRGSRASTPRASPVRPGPVAAGGPSGPCLMVDRSSVRDRIGLLPPRPVSRASPGLVGSAADGTVFFAGSVFFTSAALFAVPGGRQRGP